MNSTAARLLSTIAFAAAAAAACDREPETEDVPSAPVVEFDTASVRIETAADTFHLHVELAESAAQRTHGMMEHDPLAPDAGMLFLFTSPQPPSNGFYMFRTRSPLDIAFIDENGRIAAIRTMEPCDSPNPQTCPSYAAGVSFSSALEVNAGYFSQHGINIGDRIIHVGAGETGETPATGETGETGETAYALPLR